MYIKQVHILIEQGLQNIGVFAYSDMLPQELDLSINSIMYKMMDEQIKPLEGVKKQEQKFKLQYILDRFQNLQVKELSCTVSKLDNSYSCPLPVDYLHLISDLSQVLSECNLSPILTGNIKAGGFYLVKGQKSIIYNTITYPTNSIFLGVDGISGYTYSGTGTLLLLRLASHKKSNRLTEEEYLYQVLDNSLEQTDKDSPVSSLSGNTLYIYFRNFYIYKAFLTYLRMPKLVNSQFLTYATTDNLVIGQQYESIDNPITYNSIAYQPFVPFTIVTGHLTYSGSAKVRSYQDGDLEFTNSQSYVLIRRVIETLSIITEQSQQKVVNLAQENNV